MQLFRMLGQEPRTGLQIARLPKASGFHRDRRSDSIAIALGSAQTEGYGMPQLLHRVVQYAKLWCVPVLEDHLQPAIVIQIGQSKRPPVFHEVHSRSAR